jgi:hypothetical protein
MGKVARCDRLKPGENLKIVLIATAWGSAEGGINAFNTDFAVGLADVGGTELQIYTAVTAIDDASGMSAAAKNVRLIPVTADSDGRPADDAGNEIMAWFAEQKLTRQVDLWVGHDVVTGFAAVSAAQTHGGNIALIHHMDYQAYQNIDGGKGARTVANHQRQLKLFETPGAGLFGVGTYLTQSVKTLGGRPATLLVPGFPNYGQNFAADTPLSITLAARFDEKSESLKQGQVAAAAIGRAVAKGRNVQASLSHPTMTIFGVEDSRAIRGDFEKLARDEAGRVVTVIPSGFAPTDQIADQLRRSNLVIMPSLHEGFGLIGWEAIGLGVPLILSEGTGLYSFIRETLGGAGEGCVHSVDFRGGGDPADVEELAKAILDVAVDIPHARRDAQSLRRQLTTRWGCTWPNTAKQFLEGLACVGIQLPVGLTDRPQLHANSELVTSSSLTAKASTDNYPNIVNLTLAVGQGSISTLFDVIASIRFGRDELVVDTLDVKIGLKRAIVEVRSTHGILSERRLGDAPKVQGIEPMAGGRWQITPPRGSLLRPWTHYAAHQMRAQMSFTAAR